MQVASNPMPQALRRAVLPLLFAAVAVFVAYLSMQIPVRNLAQRPVLMGPEIGRHASMAIRAAAIVLAVDALVIAVGWRLWKHRPRAAVPASATGGSIPSPLLIERVPGWAIWAAAVVSGTALAVSLGLGLPLWGSVLWMLFPWVPVAVGEGISKYRNYGFFAVLLAIAVLHVGHLGEHGAQVFQLLLHDGDLTQAHGVFGQLDFEGVHFGWDTAVWLGGGLLLFRYWDNRWLWLSWLFASLHEVEHVYLFWLNQADPVFWARGGIAGIFGQGGLVGSPLPRPYLHFAYNFLVVIPMLAGLLIEARRVRPRA